MILFPPAMSYLLFKKLVPLPRATLITLAVLSSILLFSSSCPGQETEVVARVNDETITRGDFERMLANPLTLHQTKQELGVEGPDPKELERVALRRLIHLRLLVQEAKRRGITVSQDESDQAVADLRKQFDDLTTFGRWVMEQGLTDPELFETVRADILASRAAASLAADVEVSEEQIREYYEQNRDSLIIGTEVRLRIIAVSEQAEADEILKELQQGKNFVELAYKRSHGKLAAVGGDTGWVDFRNLPPLLQEAVARLQKGDVAGPLKKDENEYLLVGLQDHRPRQATTLEEARPEIESRLLGAERQTVIEAWFEQQKKEAEIKVFF